MVDKATPLLWTPLEPVKQIRRLWTQLFVTIQPTLQRPVGMEHGLPNRPLVLTVCGPCQARQYFNSMHENTVTSITFGRHMGMYKALCTSFDNIGAAKKQESILKGVVVVTNLCGQSGLILSQFCKACNIMLQKKPNNLTSQLC